MSHSRERLLVALAFLIISTAAAFTQTPGRIFSDARQYHGMQAFYAAGFTGVSADAPFVYRVATPWLAALADAVVTPALPRWLDLAIDDAAGLDGVPGFFAVNILASFTGAWLLTTYLRLFIGSAGIRLGLVLFWMLQWHAPVRYTYFNPVNVEPVFLVFLLLALIAIERMPRGAIERGAYVLSAIVFAGTLVRESMLLIAAVFAVRYYTLWRAARPAAVIDALPAFLPLVAGGLALAVSTQFLGVPFHPPEPLAVPLEMLRTKSIFQWTLALFFAFSPVAIALIVANPRDHLRFLRSRPDLAVYLAGCAALAFVGGTDTERLLGWSYPVMQVLIGLALERHGHALLRSPAVAFVLVAIALVSARAFWPVPAGPEEQVAMDGLGLNWASLMALGDKVFVVNNYYANLWAYYGSPSIHAVVLAFDVVLVAAIVLWLRSSRLPAPGRP